MTDALIIQRSKFGCLEALKRERLRSEQPISSGPAKPHYYAQGNQAILFKDVQQFISMSNGISIRRDQPAFSIKLRLIKGGFEKLIPTLDLIWKMYFTYPKLLSKG